MIRNDIMQSVMQEEVILVNEGDEQIGVAEKIRAHKHAALHRALSIFVFNKEGQLLLQKRAQSKYHSGGLWSNTCCSHPRPGESIEAAAHRRLKQEMGFTCPLRKVSELIYRAELQNGLVEHEYDHILIGDFSGDPVPDPSEVEDWRWVSVSDLMKEIQESPDLYSVWLQIILSKEEKLTRFHEAFDSFNRS
jgi:isopentenyl-diphosphate delta-isomerase